MNYRTIQTIRAIKMAWFVFKIKAFGKYDISIWDGDVDYAKWQYKGVVHYLPCQNQSEPIANTTGE